MNKHLLLPLALACALFTSSCKSDNDPVNKTNSVLTVDESATVFTYKADKQVVLVTTDATSWSTSITMKEQREALWCSVEKGVKDITINLKENYKKEVRTAVIKVEAKGLPTVEIAVTQAAALVERDPFFNDSGTWDANWVYTNFTYSDGGADKWKFDPVKYKDVNDPEVWTESQMGTKITVGLKLDSKFLAEYNARHINKMEMAQKGPAKVTFAILKKKAVVINAGTFPSYITETVTTEELWRSTEISAPTDVDVKPYWWAKCDASTLQNLDFALKQADGEVYLVAYITGATSPNFIYSKQAQNQLVPSYVSFTDVTGQNLYRFVGGNHYLNFYMSEPK